MLLELVLTPIFWIITNLLSLIPTYELSESFSANTSAFFDVISSTGYFFPLDALFTVITLLLGFYLIVFAISGFNWLIAKIPTIN
jgi:hypothetical protein